MSYLVDRLTDDLLFGSISKYLSEKDLYHIVEIISKDNPHTKDIYDEYLCNKLVTALSNILTKDAFNKLKEFLNNKDACITGSFIVNILSDERAEHDGDYIYSDIDIFVSERYVEDVEKFQDKLGIKYDQPYTNPDSYFVDSEFIEKSKMESEDGIIKLIEDKPLNKPNIVSILDIKLDLIFKNSIKICDYDFDIAEDEDLIKKCIGTKFGNFRYEKLQIVVVYTETSVKEYVYCKFDFNLIKNVLYVKDGIWKLDIKSIEDIIYKHISIDTSVVTHVKEARIKKYNSRGYRLNVTFELICKILEYYLAPSKSLVYIITKEKNNLGLYNYYLIRDSQGKEVKGIEYITSQCGDKCYCKKLFPDKLKHTHIIRKERISYHNMEGMMYHQNIESRPYLHNTDVILYHPEVESI